MEIAKVSNFFLNSSPEEFAASLTGTMLELEVETIQLNNFKTELELYKTYFNNGLIESAYPKQRYRRMYNYLELLSRNCSYNSSKPIVEEEENLHNCSKTSPCPCCGECASWKRDHTEFVHSKKNCPYVYFYNKKLKIEFYQTADTKLRHKYTMTFNRIASKWIVDKYNNLSTGVEDIIGKYKGKMEDMKNHYESEIKQITTKNEDTEKELKLFHRIMPQDTIQKRKEEYEERKASLIITENNIQLKIQENKDVLQKIETEQGLSEVNVEMRNIKIKNIEHKCNIKVAKLTEEKKNLEKDIETYQTEVGLLEKERDEAKLMMKVESEGYEDMEKLNEKMYGILKKQKKIPDENCSICMDSIVDECMTLKCGHHFHSSCYLSYCLTKCRSNDNGVDGRYTRTYKCPNCRGASVVLPNYHH